MANTVYNRIIIQQGLLGSTRKEALAEEAGIGPGDLLEMGAAVTGVLRHNTANGSVLPIRVAVESQTPDNETTADIDIDYTNGDTVYFTIPKSGDVLYMWLAAGETSAVGSDLVSDGDGALLVRTAAGAAIIDGSVIGQAKEVVAAVALARVLVEIR